MTRRVWTTALVLLALSGTATSLRAQEAATAEPPAKEGASNQCIFFRSLYDWTPVNNTTLILWASRTQPYHLTLTPPCNGLRFATVIGFSSRTGRLCTMDSVLVDNGPGVPERCLIQNVIKLDDDSLQALLEKAPGRAGSKASKTAPEAPQ